MSLCIRHLRFAREEFVLGPLDLDLPIGKRTVLLGPSGCGKTTLLRLIAGLEEAREGTIQFGDEIFSGPGHWLAPQKRGIAFVFQNLALWPHMKAWQQIDYAGRCGKQAAVALLDRVGLADKANRHPGELSGGEGQRVALARALAQKPRILLLDEPLRSVDPHLREELQELFLDISREEQLTKVFVTHDREEALALGEEIVLMDQGKVIETGSVETLFGRPRTAFAARFLNGAALLPLRSGVTALGPLPTPAEHDGAENSGAENNGAERYVALGPMDVEIAEEGLDCELLSKRPSALGILGEARVEGQLLRFRIPSDLETGSRIKLRLAGTPHVIDNGGAQ